MTKKTMNNKLSQYETPTEKCKKCKYFVENGLGMRYCNSPLAVICDKDDNKPAPGSNDNPYKAWEEYYESVSFFGITRD